MTHKEAISVYNPSDPLERIIQESFHSSNGEWLGKYQCQLIARAISSLKCSDNWIDNPQLLEQRISYFFVPFMNRNKSIMVFVTYPLFLRDILENCEINVYLHDPITFITPPLAHYIFREYPIHVYIDTGDLKDYNDGPWVDCGGLMISDQDIKINPLAIKRIQCKERHYTSMVENILSDIASNREIPLSKVAISQISPGIFVSDRHEREIRPDDFVWDKKNKVKAHISKVEAGETGLVSIIYDDGNVVTVPKLDFDRRYVTG